jgi:hypothetical protein
MCGSFSGVDTASASSTVVASVTGSSNTTLTATGVSNFSFTALGTFGGESVGFSFSSVVSQGGDSAALTLTVSSSDTFSGQANDTSSDQGLGNQTGVFAVSSGTSLDSTTASAADSFHTSGSDSAQRKQ